MIKWQIRRSAYFSKFWTLFKTISHKVLSLFCIFTILQKFETSCKITLAYKIDTLPERDWPWLKCWIWHSNSGRGTICKFMGWTVRSVNILRKHITMNKGESYWCKYGIKIQFIILEININSYYIRAPWCDKDQIQSQFFSRTILSNVSY